MTYTSRLITFTLITFILSVVYSAYILTMQPIGEQHETWLSEIGEFFGEIGLWLFALIYGRTFLKLSLGRGGPLQRVLPEYSLQPAMGILKKVLVQLNRTHNYVGIAAIAVTAIHLLLVGFPVEVLFFPVVLALIVWQGIFGLFLSFRYSPKQLKKFSYLVHAQLFTGVMIGLFTWFGHMLID